jgi:hypothetical protein
MYPFQPLRSRLKVKPVKFPAGDSTFLDFLMPMRRAKENVADEHATLWVNVAQLIAALIGLAIIIRRK